MTCTVHTIVDNSERVNLLGVYKVSSCLPHTSFTSHYSTSCYNSVQCWLAASDIISISKNGTLKIQDITFYTVVCEVILSALHN